MVQRSSAGRAGGGPPREVAIAVTSQAGPDERTLGRVSANQASPTKSQLVEHSGVLEAETLIERAGPTGWHRKLDAASFSRAVDRRRHERSTDAAPACGLVDHKLEQLGDRPIREKRRRLDGQRVPG